jgi:hypothetical protein
MHRRNPHHGHAGSARPPQAEQTLRFLRPIGVEISLQQCELDQVVLRAAATDALVLAGERGQRLDRAQKIAAFEGPQATRQRWKVRAGRVTPLARQLLHLSGTGIQRGIIFHDNLCQSDVQIGEPAAPGLSAMGERRRFRSFAGQR